MCSDIIGLINMFSSNNQYHLSNIHEGLGIVQTTFACIILFDLFNNPRKQAKLPEFLKTQGWEWGKVPHTNQERYRNRSGIEILVLSDLKATYVYLHLYVYVCAHVCVCARMYTCMYMCPDMCICIEARRKPMVSFISCGDLNKNAPHRLTSVL